MGGERWDFGELDGEGVLLEPSCRNGEKTIENICKHPSATSNINMTDSIIR
jgi:hypothetical protein